MKDFLQSGILWDSATSTLSIKNRALTRELLLYYLGHLKEVGRIKNVRARYALLLDDVTAWPPSRPAAVAKRIGRRPRPK